MRIVVVEDEDRIRNGIVRLINNMSSGYEVIGEAENGLTGLELIAFHKPDLVIVDIKMHEMDGIEMLTLLKESGVKHKTVILSGYSDFDYAQKAIKLGVCEYLLKPITASDLEQTLKNIENEIAMEKALVSRQPNVLNTLEHIFQNLVLGENAGYEELFEYLHKTYDIDPNGKFITVNIYLGREINDCKNKVLQVLARLLDDFRGIKYCMFELALNFELVLVIYNYSDPSGLEHYFQNIVIKNIANLGINNYVFGWTSFEGMQNLKNKLNLLRKELKWSIVLGNDVLISYPKVLEINTKLVRYPINIETDAKAAMCSLDIAKIERLFDEFLSWWGKDLYHPAGVIEAFIRFASSIINVVKEVNYEFYKKINQKETLQRIIDSVTWRELKAALVSIIDKALVYKSKDTPIISLVIQKALSMMNEFYIDGITLEKIAERMNITPEYLGSLFYKEIGVNFSTYIKEFRLKKAKELLIGTNLKTYEISNQVGYSDPKYFSRVFKEATGLTPSQYQKSFK
ncbi:MAG: response regulator [Bacillota bacterium]|nr:response regulator [Bacillota bacterium]